MNDNRVVTVEKKATNKVGLLLLLVIVMAGLGFAAYYYISNKNVISFEFKLPWEKDKEVDEDDEEGTVDESGKKREKETPITREKISIEETTIYNNRNFTIRVIGYDLKDNGYTIKLKATNTDATGMVQIKVKEIKVNDYQMGQSFNLQIGANQEATYEIQLTSEMLDKNRIDAINNIVLIAEEDFGEEKLSDNIFISVSSSGNIREINPIAKIATVNNNVQIHYYKSEESEDNTKVYFLISNFDNIQYTYYVNRMLVNNKDIEVSTYHERIYGNAKYVSIVNVPKSMFSKNTKIKVSFVLVKDDKSYYKTIEKEINL